LELSIGALSFVTSDCTAGNYKGWIWASAWGTPPDKRDYRKLSDRSAEASVGRPHRRDQPLLTLFEHHVKPLSVALDRVLLWGLFGAEECARKGSPESVDTSGVGVSIWHG
jgi:hypothetical protein